MSLSAAEEKKPDIDIPEITHALRVVQEFKDFPVEVSGLKETLSVAIKSYTASPTLEAQKKNSGTLRAVLLQIMRHNLPPEDNIEFYTSIYLALIKLAKHFPLNNTEMTAQGPVLQDPLMCTSVGPQGIYTTFGYQYSVKKNEGLPHWIMSHHATKDPFGQSFSVMELSVLRTALDAYSDQQMNCTCNACLLCQLSILGMLTGTIAGMFPALCFENGWYVLFGTGAGALAGGGLGACAHAEHAENTDLSRRLAAEALFLTNQGGAAPARASALSAELQPASPELACIDSTPLLSGADLEAKIADVPSQRLGLRRY